MNRQSQFARFVQFGRRATKRTSVQSFDELFGGRIDELDQRFDTSLFEADLFGTLAPLPDRDRDRRVRRALSAAPWSAETEAISLAENAMPDPPWTGRIPPRTTSTGGRAFMATIDRLLGGAREDKIEAELRAGNIPDFLRTPRINLVFVPTADGVVHSVSYRVMPDYLCIGTDDDYVRMPVTSITAQRIADAWGLFLPTAKMVDQIYEHAEVPLVAEIPPYSGTPQQADTAKMLDHHDRIARQIDRLDGLPPADRQPPWRISRWRLGALVAGHKKEIVTSILAYRYPNNMMFYGWFKANGLPWQPASGRKGMAAVAHDPTFSDYSQGARLVSKMALVDGTPRAIVDVLRDKTLHVLLSGEGAPYPASQEPRATVRVTLPVPAPVARESSEGALDLIPVLDAGIKKLTLYPRITLGGEGPAAPVTGIFVPKAFVARPKIDAILWLQGHHSSPPNYPADLNIYDYWDRSSHPLFRFREELNLAGRSLVLVAPTLGPTSGAGWLVDPGGLDRYMELVRKELVASSAGVAESATWGNLVIACHSGGGARMLKIATEKNVLGANITQCWGFDCLYYDGDVPAWITWANQGGKRLYVYYGNGGTAELSKKLETEARKQWLLNVTVYVDGSTSTGHNEVPIKHWRQRIEALPP